MTTQSVVTVEIREVKWLDDQRTSFKGTVTAMKQNIVWEAERKGGNLIVKLADGLPPKVADKVREMIKGYIGVVNVPMSRTQSIITES